MLPVEVCNWELITSIQSVKGFLDKEGKTHHFDVFKELNCRLASAPDSVILSYNTELESRITSHKL